LKAFGQAAIWLRLAIAPGWAYPHKSACDRAHSYQILVWRLLAITPVHTSMSNLKIISLARSILATQKGGGLNIIELYYMPRHYQSLIKMEDAIEHGY
jgi:hypothetical protein